MSLTAIILLGLKVVGVLVLYLSFCLFVAAFIGHGEKMFRQMESRANVDPRRIQHDYPEA